MLNHQPDTQRDIATETKAVAALDTQLSAILDRIQSLQNLDLGVVAEHRQALEESRRLLGTLYFYRQQLARLYPAAVSMRHAA